jgi:hypothetical protein
MDGKSGIVEFYQVGKRAACIYTESNHSLLYLHTAVASTSKEFINPQGVRES